jgi:hypothetical protein
MRGVFRRIAAGATIASLALSLAGSTAFADESSRQTVEQLAEKAYQQHAAGKYADSIATYLKAYEISKASETLFNVATIYDRKLNERELAEDYYRRYIRQPDANPDLVRRATERLTTMKREAQEEMARKAALPAPTPVAATAPVAVSPELAPRTRPDPGWHTAGIIVGATGVAGVLAGLALGAAAKTKNDTANGECSGQSCASQQGVTDARDAGRFATFSTVSVAAGGALVAAGLALYIAAPSRPYEARTGSTLTIAPQAGSRGGGMSLAVTF